MKRSNFFVALLALAAALAMPARAEFKLTHADYTDRAHAAWLAQMIGVELGVPHEHRKASVPWLDKLASKRDRAWVDDDGYYEMSALRAFEVHGPGLTVQQLGEQCKKDVCGMWDSSKETRLLLARGIQPADTGHPRYNPSWWTIGPQFSAEIYGPFAPGRPNLAAQLAREFGHVNGYAEGVDGAVFVAGAVSLGFVEKDPRKILRDAASLIHPESPYGGRAWELSVFMDNKEFSKPTIVSAPKQVKWQTIDVDLKAYAGRKVTLRLYQNFETI